MSDKLEPYFIKCLCYVKAASTLSPAPSPVGGDPALHISIQTPVRGQMEGWRWGEDVEGGYSSAVVTG